MVVLAAFGLSLPFFLNGVIAFVGGLRGRRARAGHRARRRRGPTRLVLAGSAVALALDALTILLLLLFQQNTIGVFAWGSGTIVQSGTRTVARAAPVVLLAGVVLVLCSRRLDVLALGDDTASVLGVDVRRTRIVAVLSPSCWRRSRSRWPGRSVSSGCAHR